MVRLKIHMHEATGGGGGGGDLCRHIYSDIVHNSRKPKTTYIPTYGKLEKHILVYLHNKILLISMRNKLLLYAIKMNLRSIALSNESG